LTQSSSDASPVDKWQWFDAMYADKRFTVAEKDVLAWLAVKAVFSGRDTFRIRQCTVTPTSRGFKREAHLRFERADFLSRLQDRLPGCVGQHGQVCVA